MAANVLVLPREKAIWPQNADTSKYCYFHRQPGHIIDTCFQFRDYIHDLNEQGGIDWEEMKKYISALKARRPQQQQARAPSQAAPPPNMGRVQNPLPEHQNQNQVAPILTNSRSEANRGQQWRIEDSSSIYSTGHIPSTAEQPPRRTIHIPRPQPITITPIPTPAYHSPAPANPLPPPAFLKPITPHTTTPPLNNPPQTNYAPLLPSRPLLRVPFPTSPATTTAYPDTIQPYKPLLRMPFPTSSTIQPSRLLIRTTPPLNPTPSPTYQHPASSAPSNPAVLKVSPGPSTAEEHALRSGRIFNKVFPQSTVRDGPSQPTEEAHNEESAPGTQYDLLKHLDRTPARISVLELIKRSKSHQEALMEYL